MDNLRKSFLVKGNSIVGAVGDKYYSSTAIGVIQAFSGNIIPRGFLVCNGASYKVADYPDLYAVIGNTYGGDTENFNVPTVQPPSLTMVYIIKAFHTNEGVDSGVSDVVINYINDSLVDKQDFRIFKSLEEFNEKKGTSFTVVSGVDNMVDIANAMSEGDMLIITTKYNTGSEIYFGLDSSTGWTKIFTFIKANGLCDVECRTTSPSTFKRVLNMDGVIGAWQELATMDKLGGCSIIKGTTTLTTNQSGAINLAHGGNFDHCTVSIQPTNNSPYFFSYCPLSKNNTYIIVTNWQGEIVTNTEIEFDWVVIGW